jgi:hypothetical protein
MRAHVFADEGVSEHAGRSDPSSRKAAIAAFVSAERSICGT